MKTNKYLDYREMNHILEEDITQFANDFQWHNELSGKVVAVTGATGLLGSCMVRCLLALNRKYNTKIYVLAVVRNVQKAMEMFGEANPQLGFYAYDFSSNKLFSPEKKPDFIIHLASPTASKFFVENPVETMNIVYEGTKTLLEYAKKNKVESLLLASSLEVYGVVTDDSTPLTEETFGELDPMDSRSSYPMAKRAAEALCHNYAIQYGVPAKVARLAQTFGAGVAKDDKRVFAQFARNILNNEDIVMFTTGELSRSYCYTMDALTAMYCILLRGKDGEAYNVANETTYMSIKNMAKFLVREFNSAVKVVVQLKENMGYSPVTRLRLSTQKIAQLGWKPKYGLSEMFHRLIESMKEE